MIPVVHQIIEPVDLSLLFELELAGRQVSGVLVARVGNARDRLCGVMD